MGGEIEDSGYDHDLDGQYFQAREDDLLLCDPRKIGKPTLLGASRKRCSF